MKLHIIKCGVSGPPETGKSHVRALMLGLDRPKERRSTAVAAEADQVTPDDSTKEDLTKEDLTKEDLVGMKKTGKGCEWKIIRDRSMARFIANTLHNRDYKKVEEESTKESRLTTTELKKRCKVIIDIKKQLRNLHGKPKRKRKGLNTIRIVFFVDTGGQPQFQEILPNFIRCDINLLVHNLSQTLNHCPEFNYVIDGRKFTVPERMRLSNSDIIEQSVRSITSNISTSESKPSVAIVGTFKDKCNPDSDQYKPMLKEKSKEINKRLNPYVGSGIDKCGIFSPQREQRIFDIDASEQGWDLNSDSLENLKTNILDSAQNHPVEVPIRYFLFLQSIQAFAKTKPPGKNQYVTLEECYQVASDNDIAMTKSDVKKALELFDDCNLILYFPDILVNVIFVKPGFLFGMVTDLIVASFECESDNMTTDFQITGIFTQRILNDIASLQLTDKNFTQQNFLDLLKGLFIIAEVTRGHYFMPCVLPIEKATSEELRSTEECMKSNNIDGPLMFSFPQRMSPRGLFCALVVALVADSSWELSTEGMYRRRNVVELEYSHLNKHIGQVTVIDRKSHFEVYTTCDPSYCLGIKHSVSEAFKKACDNMNYGDSKIIGLPCRCKEPEIHSTKVDQLPKGGLWRERCSVNHRTKLIPLTPDRLLWFDDASSQNNDSLTVYAESKLHL